MSLATVKSWTILSTASDDSEPSFKKMQSERIGPYILEQKHCDLLLMFRRKKNRPGVLDPGLREPMQYNITS